LGDIPEKEYVETIDDGSGLLIDEYKPKGRVLSTLPMGKEVIVILTPPKFCI